MELSLGNRLRRLRQRRKLSQRKLARMSDVANATISLIEHDKLNPTVSMLKKILDGIPISMSEFFNDDDNQSQRFYFRANELTQIGDSKVSYRQVGSNLDKRAIQLLHECYEPDAGTGKHQLTHNGEECGLVLSGSLEVTVDGQTVTLHPGDAYYFDSSLPHRFRRDHPF